MSKTTKESKSKPGLTLEAEGDVVRFTFEQPPQSEGRSVLTAHMDVETAQTDENGEPLVGPDGSPVVMPSLKDQLESFGFEISEFDEEEYQRARREREAMRKKRDSD